LLDRLCDVGAERPRPAAEPARLAWLDDLAAKSQRRRQRIQSALGRVTSLGEGEASS
jgi:hypothetical protein